MDTLQFKKIRHSPNIVINLKLWNLFREMLISYLIIY